MQISEVRVTQMEDIASAKAPKQEPVWWLWE